MAGNWGKVDAKYLFLIKDTKKKGQLENLVPFKFSIFFRDKIIFKFEKEQKNWTATVYPGTDSQKLE